MINALKLSGVVLAVFVLSSAFVFTSSVAAEPVSTGDWLSRVTKFLGTITGFQVSDGDKDGSGVTPSKPACVDSDGGEVLDVKGTVSMANNPNYPYTDFCFNSGAEVSEYSCWSDGTLTLATHPCPNGCKDGACLTTTKTSLTCPAKITASADRASYAEGDGPGLLTVQATDSSGNPISAKLKELHSVNRPLNGDETPTEIATDASGRYTMSIPVGSVWDGKHYFRFSSTACSPVISADAAFEVHSVSPVDDQTPPSCKTLDTRMYKASDGTGYIGCDVEVSGEFNLEKSYCESQKTVKYETLIPDGYRRANRYYATLTGLDLAEEVKVFVVAKSGEEVECLPSLNKVALATPKASCTDSDGGKNYNIKGVGTGIYVGSTGHVIYGQEPNPGVPKNTDKPYSTYYDYCPYPESNPNQLNEAYCDETGKLAAYGINCPSGCKGGVCLHDVSFIDCAKNGKHTLREGEASNVYNFYGTTYVISADSVSSLTAIFTINGQVLKDVHELGKFTLADGTILKTFTTVVDRQPYGMQFCLQKATDVTARCPSSVKVFPSKYSYSQGETAEFKIYMYDKDGKIVRRGASLDVKKADGSLMYGKAFAATDSGIITVAIPLSGYKIGSYVVQASSEAGECPSMFSDKHSISIVPSSPSCSDSDGGLDYYVKGTVKYNSNPAATDSCSGNTVDEHYCDAAGYARTTFYGCPNGCSDGACVKTESSALDLANYPYPFVKDGKINSLIVVGDRADSTTVIASVDIAGGLQQLTGGSLSARLASEVADYKAQNVISVGPACANAITSAIMGNPADCTHGMAEGRGIIKLFNFGNGNLGMMVAGYSSMDTRRAARVLVNYKEWQGSLKGQEVWVTGTSFTDIQVVPPGAVSVCGNSICEKGEATECIATCKPGQDPCPAAPCSVGNCPQDCQSTAQTGYDGASWVCYDGSTGKAVGYEGFCKTSEEFRSDAEVACKGRCNNHPALEDEKCGVNSFALSGKCAISVKQSCTDSDGGLDYYLYGKTTGIYDGVQGFSTDYCSSGGTDENGKPVNLIEFYCIDGVNYGSEQYYCPNGCSDGACVKEEKPAVIEYNVEIATGWNLVNALPIMAQGQYEGQYGSSSCSWLKGGLGDESAAAVYLKRNMFSYDPLKNKYVSVGELGAIDSLPANGGYLVHTYLNSFWLRSREECSITLNVPADFNPDILSIIAQSDYKLAKGWNFFSVWPEMTGRTLDDINGDCNIIRAYGYDASQPQWINLKGIEFGHDAVWHGIIIKVATDCTLGASVGAPPPLPMEEEQLAVQQATTVAATARSAKTIFG